MSPIILIPARMAATRLPGKPLAEIAGEPMIAHVVARARESAAGPVAVATDDAEIAAAAEAAGAISVMTRADHVSGSDRIHEAVQKIDPGEKYKSVVNLQGDLPTLDPAMIAAAMVPLGDPSVDIATLAAEITDEAERTNPAVVKVAGTPVAADRLRALYFSRATIPTGPGPHYHHIGLYAFRRSALAQFVALAPGTLERREKLEQLRALEAGMRIDVMLVDTVPLGVDTPADLDRARRVLANGALTGASEEPDGKAR